MNIAHMDEMDTEFLDGTMERVPYKSGRFISTFNSLSSYLSTQEPELDGFNEY